MLEKELLEEIGADSETKNAFAALGELWKKNTTLGQIEQEFGKECMEIVEIAQVARLEKAAEGEKTEAAKKLLLATSKDLRATTIALLGTLQQLRQTQEKKLAELVLKVYAPIAHKLGIRKIKNSLEDTAFKTLCPKEFEEIKKAVEEKEIEREQRAREVAKELWKKLGEAGIKAKVLSRAKHCYSIWNKMQRKGVGFQEINEKIFDLVAVRAIVDTEKQCYEALGTVHSLWNPLPGEFDDFIAKPRPNGYRSLHTAVIGPQGKPIEIQIRTREMHAIAETGVAAHWKYKGEKPFREEMEKKLSWIKEALELQQDKEKAKQFLENLKMDFFENEIVVFTPKGKAIELPEESTPIDFAFAIHSSIGFKCSGAKADGKMVPLNHQLKNGETIEILASEGQKPKSSWLRFVKTKKAVTKIRSALKMHKTIAKEKKTEYGTRNITISGPAQKNIKLAKCCSPIPGDEIIGFVTTKRKISVHRADCENTLKFGENNLVAANWGHGAKIYSTELKVKALERPGLLSDILQELARAGSKVLGANAKTLQKKQLECLFQVEAKNIQQLEKTIEKIGKINGVLSIKRA